MLEKAVLPNHKPDCRGGGRNSGWLPSVDDIADAEARVAAAVFLRLAREAGSTTEDEPLVAAQALAYLLHPN